MTNQIIKTYVDIFESFVKKHFILEQDYYVYNMDVYKKLSFGTELKDFLYELKTVESFLINLKKKNISGFLIQVLDPLEINFSIKENCN